MAESAKKTTTATQPRRPVMIEYLEPEAEVEVSDEELIFQKFKDEFSQGENYASITVYRQPTGYGGRASKQKLTYLFECGLDEYSFPQLLAHLRDGYGSGTYRIQGHSAERKMLFNRAVEVEAPPRPTSDSTAPNPAAIMESVQRMLGEQQRATEEMLTRMASNQRPTQDPMDFMVKLAGAIGAIITPLAPIFAARSQTPAPQTSDFLSELTKFAKVKEVISDLAGGGGDGGGSVESNFYDLAGKAVEHLGPLVAAAAANGAFKGTPQLPAPAATDPAKRPIPEAQQTNGANPQMRKSASGSDPIKKQVDILVANAKMGNDPRAVAEMVLDMTPDEKLDELQKFVSDVHVIERMAQANPEVRNYMPFFQALREHLLTGLQIETDADNNAPTDTTGTVAANAAMSTSPDDGSQ